MRMPSFVAGGLNRLPHIVAALTMLLAPISAQALVVKPTGINRCPWNAAVDANTAVPTMTKPATDSDIVLIPAPGTFVGGKTAAEKDGKLLSLATDSPTIDKRYVSGKLANLLYRANLALYVASVASITPPALGTPLATVPWYTGATQLLVSNADRVMTVLEVATLFDQIYNGDPFLAIAPSTVTMTAGVAEFSNLKIWRVPSTPWIAVQAKSPATAPTPTQQQKDNATAAIHTVLTSWMAGTWNLPPDLDNTIAVAAGGGVTVPLSLDQIINDPVLPTLQPLPKTYPKALIASLLIGGLFLAGTALMAPAAGFFAAGAVTIGVGWYIASLLGLISYGLGTFTMFPQAWWGATEAREKDAKAKIEADYASAFVGLSVKDIGIIAEYIGSDLDATAYNKRVAYDKMLVPLQNWATAAGDRLSHPQVTTLRTKQLAYAKALSETIRQNADPSQFAGATNWETTVRTYIDVMKELSTPAHNLFEGRI